MVIIGRPINGVWINGLEYALNDDGSLRTWKDHDSAETFLMTHGETAESIEEEARMEEEALREAEEIKVLIRLGTIIESNDAIEYLGLNPWCVNEGADPNTTYEIPVSKAKEFGFIK